ncbi:hypothetical protein IEQ34_011091 [Dendrobium chrysotoxum]|uniref:Uncharacterized protein n=1 Tax=Dendrobium chrysotoxum TaxID=161865 RepID=A0AAV7GXP7_DENCH|nr:hypothetical protein IEQ34_011091 [Dendrobium chrysotoxum]
MEFHFVAERAEEQEEEHVEEMSVVRRQKLAMHFLSELQAVGKMLQQLALYVTGIDHDAKASQHSSPNCHPELQNVISGNLPFASGRSLSKNRDPKRKNQRCKQWVGPVLPSLPPSLPLFLLLLIVSIPFRVPLLSFSQNNLASCRILSHLPTEMTVVRGLEEELTNEFEEVRPPTLRSVVSCNGPRRTSNFTFRAPQENFTIDDFELGPVLGVGSFSKMLGDEVMVRLHVITTILGHVGGGMAPCAPTMDLFMCVDETRGRRKERRKFQKKGKVREKKSDFYVFTTADIDTAVDFSVRYKCLKLINPSNPAFGAHRAPGDLVYTLFVAWWEGIWCGACGEAGAGGLREGLVRPAVRGVGLVVEVGAVGWGGVGRPAVKRKRRVVADCWKMGRGKLGQRLWRNFGRRSREKEKGSLEKER